MSADCARSLPARAPHRPGQARNAVLTGPTSIATASRNSFGPHQGPWGDVPMVPVRGHWSPHLPVIPTRIVTPSLKQLRWLQNAQ